MTDVDIGFKLPSNDFYLQWEHIYWWQFQFNLMVMLRNELERLGCEKR